MLYLTMLTLFTSIMAWDTKRVHRKWGDFCGVCFCKEDIFFKAWGLTDKQKEYSGISIKKVSQVKKFFGDEEGTDQVDESAIELSI